MTLWGRKEARRLSDRGRDLRSIARARELTDEESAELASVQAQLDVIGTAEAILRGEFADQIERSKTTARCVQAFIDAHRAHDMAIEGGRMDVLVKMASSESSPTPATSAAPEAATPAKGTP